MKKIILFLMLPFFLFSCENDEPPKQEVSEYELIISAGEINYSGFSVDININAEILQGNDLHGDYKILYGSSELDLSKSIVIETDTSFENYSDKSYNFAELTYGKTYIQVVFDSEILDIKSNIIVVDTIGLSADGFINGHAYVDLGLPSGLKWATCNVGAKTPYNFGNYYAWGEISTKSSYSKNNSRTYGMEHGDISGNPEYDAARANWGGSWRMPTKAEWEELLNNCMWDGVYENGKHYTQVISRKNGKYIYLPHTGRYNSNYYCDYAYWSSTPVENYNTLAYCLHEYAEINMRSYSRYEGLNVRAVSE